MPVSFPTLNPSTGELVPTDYWTVGEVAELLHVSHSTVRRRILANEWHHLTIAQGHYMNATHIAEVVAMHTMGPELEIPPEIPPECNGNGTPRLGIPLDPDDLEGMT